jgi:hypothetical protein
MPSFPRLVLKVPLAQDQKQAVKYLMDAEGLCVCGRFLKPTDGKFCLGQVNTHYFPDPKGKNLLIVAAYCFACANRINDVLKSLRGILATPEPDRRRHEGAS